MDKQEFFEVLQQARQLSLLTLEIMLKGKEAKTIDLKKTVGDLAGAFEDAGSFLNTTFARLDKFCVLTLCVILKGLEDEYGAYLGLDIEEGKEKTDGRI